MSEAAEETRVCRKCGRTLPLSAFRIIHHGKPNTWCKRCENQRRTELRRDPSLAAAFKAGHRGKNLHPFPENIDRTRTYSQSEIGRMIGVTRSTIYLIEKAAREKIVTALRSDPIIFELAKWVG